MSIVIGLVLLTILGLGMWGTYSGEYARRQSRPPSLDEFSRGERKPRE
jgi:hypothetical protein